MSILKIVTENNDKLIEFNHPINLSEILIKNNIYIDRPCSGKGTCGKCLIKFLSGAPSPNLFDNKHLTKSQIENGYRISCKCILDKDAIIELLLENKMTIQQTGISNKNEIHLIDKGISDSYGAAIDLGTTTIVAYLVRLSDGKILSVQSAINPQRKYGDNVITRSEYIHNNKNGLKTLQLIVSDEINNLLEKLCIENNLINSDIKRLVLSGNTIMQHIFCGINPYQITIAPFTPVFTEQKIFSTQELGVNISKNAKCYITNSISGYIGGDIVSGIIATGINKSQLTSLLVDIGTNGEIVLRHKGKMYACSVAAGPAFEGEHIKFGLGGVAGAINKAYLKDNNLVCETIGKEEPVGICGSGLLDIAAFLLEHKVVDEMGTMDSNKCQIVDNEPAYYITKNIYISQKDIREIQLAKSAIAAGIEVLLKKSKLNYSDVDKVYLAGGFGSYLNVESASKIGLINSELTEKCITAGNTSGMGSIKSLLSDKVLQSLNTLAENVEYLELSLDKTFNDLFVENMIF